MENTLNQKALLIDATNDVRVEFLKKTYKHVAGGVLLFVLFEYFLLQSDADCSVYALNDRRLQMAHYVGRIYVYYQLCRKHRTKNNR